MHCFSYHKWKTYEIEPALFLMVFSISFGQSEESSNEVNCFLACCQGSKPVLEAFGDIQCVFLEDSRRHCIFLKHYWEIPEL